MEASTAVAPPQRVCPKCARISWATGPQCPYCTAKFRSGRGISPWMLVSAVAIVLVGVALMLVVAGNEMDKRINDQVQSVNDDFNKSLKTFQSDLEKEFDARIGSATGAGAIPTPTVAPPAEITPAPTASPDPLATETATAAPTEAATAEATPTETPRTEIRP